MIAPHPLAPHIGAELSGIDVKSLDDAAFAAIYRAWLDHNVLVIHGQDLDIDAFLTYSRRFGILAPHPSKSTRHPDYPDGGAANSAWRPTCSATRCARSGPIRARSGWSWPVKSRGAQRKRLA